MRWLVCLGVLWIAPCVAADESGVRTDRQGARAVPLPKEEGVFHFVIFGDRTGGPAEGIQVLAQGVKDTNLLGPDLVMTVGDLIQGYSGNTPWLAEMREYRDTMAALEMPWYPVAGNHDVYWRGSPPPPGHHETNYEKHFGPLWYWFPHKNAAFVVLYSDEGDAANNRKGWNAPKLNQMSPAQLAWLGRTLEETKGFDHVFVFLHHPRWRKAYYPGTNWDDVHALLKAAGNVTAVFAGHIHRATYAGTRDGIEYVTLATTGGGIPFDVPGTGYAHHLDLVTVRADRITLASLPIGQVLDPRAMTPAHLADVDALRAVTPELGGVPLLLEADGATAGVLTVQLRNPAKRPAEVEVRPATGDRAWWFAPRHAHLKLAPGQTATASFRVGRDGDGFGGFRVPDLELQADLLAEGLRVALPARTLPLPVRLKQRPPAPAEGRPDLVLALDGHVQCAEVPPGALRLPDGPFTIEAWVKPRSLGPITALLAKTENSEYGLFAIESRPVFAIRVPSGYVQPEGQETPLETGRWQHVAGVFDGAEARVYLDGVLAARVAGAGARVTNELPFFVGADPNGHGEPTRGFRGEIDEVRVSTTVRYTEDFEPAARFEPDEHTLLLLHFDQALGPFVFDSGPHENHARLRGGARLTTR